MLHVESVHIGEMLLTVSTLLKKSGVSIAILEYIILYQTHTSLISVNVSATIALSTNEVSLVGDWAKDPRKEIPKLPAHFKCSFITMHNKTIIVGGKPRNANVFKCLKLHHGMWKEHSILNEERMSPSVVATDNGTFIFGGDGPNEWNGMSTNRISYEYLPKDSTAWKVGKTQVPTPWSMGKGCAISIPSDKLIWIMGTLCNVSSILKFNVDTHTFLKSNTTTKEKRRQKRCISIPGTKKILITGGTSYFGTALNTTEIFDTETETISFGPPMNIARASHGIGIMTINSDNRIVVFGGTDNENIEEGGLLDSVEFYNTKAEKWTLTNLRLTKADVFHGNISIKGNFISDLLE